MYTLEISHAQHVRYTRHSPCFVQLSALLSRRLKTTGVGLVKFRLSKAILAASLLQTLVPPLVLLHVLNVGDGFLSQIGIGKSQLVSLLLNHNQSGSGVSQLQLELMAAKLFVVIIIVVVVVMTSRSSALASNLQLGELVLQLGDLLLGSKAPLGSFAEQDPSSACTSASPS